MPNFLEDIISGERIIIGVRDYIECNDPESRLYVNDLPGMSLKMAANVAPDHWNSGAEFLRQCTIMAARQVFDEFATELQPYFNFANIVETRDLKVFETTYGGASSAERGIVIKRWRSEAVRMYVENIYFNVENEGTYTFTITDGSLVTAITNVECIAGLNVIHVDYRAENESIRITHHADSLTADGTWNKSSGCSTCGGGANKGLYVTGWDGTREVSNTFGLGVMVHAQCYEEPILCSLLPKMYFLLWYKSGILVLKEHVATNRLNHIATFGIEKAKENLANLEAEYKEKYAILVKSAYNFLRTTKGECIACNGIRYAQATP